MSVLAEALSIIVSRAAIDDAYPGGLAAFERDAPADTFCLDGYLVRVGFYDVEDARRFAALLEASGLAATIRGAAADYVLVMPNLTLDRPCLWLELGRERDGTPVAWHAAARRGVLHAPHGWRPAREPLDTGALLADARRPFERVVRFLRTEDAIDWYHDKRSGRLVTFPRYCLAH